MATNNLRQGYEEENPAPLIEPKSKSYVDLSNQERVYEPPEPKKENLGRYIILGLIIGIAIGYLLGAYTTQTDPSLPPQSYEQGQRDIMQSLIGELIQCKNPIQFQISPEQYVNVGLLECLQQYIKNNNLKKEVTSDNGI